MAIIAACASPNFAHGDYHRILRVDIHCAPNEEFPRYVVHIGHYHSVQARELNPQPMHVNQETFLFKDLPAEQDPRIFLYAKLMESATFAPFNPVSDVITE